MFDSDGVSLGFVSVVEARGGARPFPALFVPFADAGGTGNRYQVWLRAPGVAFPDDESLLLGGQESRSRQGNLGGSINDGDPATPVVTFDGEKRDEDWFAVALDAPATIGRIVFVHGKNFHDGGWFDASVGGFNSFGKPKVQVKRTKGADWETVGTLDNYPATTATDPAGLRDGRAFTLRLAEPVGVVAVRVIGKPASGDSPAQAFASCGELSAFAK
jgi:hypothetical protein